MRRPLFQLLLIIFGIKIKCNIPIEKVRTHTQGCVVAGNHVSVFDFIPSLMMPLSTVMVVNTSGKASFLIEYLFFLISGAKCWRVEDLRSLSRHFGEWRKDRTKTALYTTPEGTINNGSGLFRFRPDFLNKGFTVVPLAIKLKLPFGVSAHPVPMSGTLRFLRLLMMPFLYFEWSYLSQRVPTKSQSKQAFADEIQANIAEYLGVQTTTFTPEDKRKFVLESSKSLGSRSSQT